MDVTTEGITNLLVQRLTTAGLAPRALPPSTGVVVDVGDGPRTVAVHAGAVAHTPVALEVALEVALGLSRAPRLPGRARVIFQPADETMGAARAVIAAGELAGVERIFTLKCDPRLQVGRVGIQLGPIAAARDMVDVRVNGPGGHTARPHLTVDVVDTLSRIAVDTPALLARRTDVRAGLLLTWCAIQAGDAPNVIPSKGALHGTVRVLDQSAWAGVEKQFRSIVSDIAAACGAGADIRYQRGVPPVINDDACVQLMHDATRAELGAEAVTRTNPSMTGEDFAWYGEHTPLAMARLGVHGDIGTDASGEPRQGNFDLDERAIGIGVRVLTRTVLDALSAPV